MCGLVTRDLSSLHAGSIGSDLPDNAHFLQKIHDQYAQGENKASKRKPFGSPISRVYLTEALARVSVVCGHLGKYSYLAFTTKCRLMQAATRIIS